ncbi:MAG: DNA polymerase III, partial [Treponema sp.]|jgi:DNA polymerase-3 subunit gamma/tau|nr:DNA polymerase III [Treponema sp.]
MKKAAKLEAEGLGEFIPIARIRRAAWWSRLAPLGKHKCLMIENAEHTQEGARNALLKILEEPPPRVTIILTSSRPGSLLPTMLSRLREYRFARRSAEAEAEVISRIFRKEPAEPGTGPAASAPALSVESYLASFLPVTAETLSALGAVFAASAAAEAARERKRRGRDVPPPLRDFGSFCAAAAERGGMGRPPANTRDTLAKISAGAEGFEIPSLFSRFLRHTGALVSGWLRSGEGGPEKTAWAVLWQKELDRAALENGSFNITPALALERLAEALKQGMLR